MNLSLHGDKPRWGRVAIQSQSCCGTKTAQTPNACKIRVLPAQEASPFLFPPTMLRTSLVLDSLGSANEIPVRLQLKFRQHVGDTDVG